MPKALISESEKPDSSQESPDFGRAKKGQFDLTKKGQFDLDYASSDFSLMKKGQFDMDYANSDFSLTKKGSFDITELHFQANDLLFL